MADSTADDVRTTAAAATDDHGDESSVAAAHPVAVKRGATMSVTLVLLALLVASVAVFFMSSPHDTGERVGQGAGEEGGKMQASEPIEHAVGDVGIPGFNSRLDAFRTWAKLTWMKLRRPRSAEPPRYDESGSASTVAGAAKKSFQMGKETVEQAAAAAGAVTGEAVEKATEKAKRAAVAADDDEDL